MDYQKIYTAFIADRKRVENDVQGYVERHHILPRSLGGSDDPSNVIRLTPEDHFFAHLLLAKIHGGKMWSPIAFMVGGARRFYRPVESRKSYGWVKRALAKSKSGDGSYQFDKRVHSLRHKDGRTWSGHQADMARAIGVSKAAACLLVNAKLSSANGWHVEGRPAIDRSGSNHHAHKSDVFEFRHVDGREFRGTRYQMHVASGLPDSKVSNLVTGRQKVAGGWHLLGVKLPKTGRLAHLGGRCAAGEHGVGEIHLRHVDGRTFSGTRRDAAEAYGISPGNLSMVINGRRKRANGWALAG